MASQSRTVNESIMVVDDQSQLSNTLDHFLTELGYRVSTGSSAVAAIEHARCKPLDLLLIDMHLLERDGLDLSHDIRQVNSEIEIVMMTASATFEKSVQAMRYGASDLLLKPLRLNEVAHVLRQVLKRRRERLQTRNKHTNGLHKGQSDAGKGKRWLKMPVSLHTPEHPASLIGQAPVMKQLFDILSRVADSESTVLITGATGSGKELVARNIHEQSRRAHAPFVDINCAAIPDTLIEAELFGYQRGTFSGAHETRRGLFEVASSGTLFLDEVDALSPSAQVKLLRVLQERYVRRVGARENTPVDVRIISATNRDLKKAVAQGTFREDLLYRLRVVPVHVPELREHKEDIPALTSYFLQRFAARRVEPDRRFSAEAMLALMAYKWPGNVRELENAVEYAYTVSLDEELGIDDLPPETVRINPENCDVLNGCLQSNVSLAEAERLYILSMFERCGRHHIKTASILGVDRRTLYRRLQQYGAKLLENEEMTVVPVTARRDTAELQ